jgi:hypothetical protein
MIDKVIKYESGEMTQGEVVELFQELIDRGMVWHLQGSYGRTAQELIEAGLCYYTDPRIDDIYTNI